MNEPHWTQYIFQVSKKNKLEHKSNRKGKNGKKRQKWDGQKKRLQKKNGENNECCSFVTLVRASKLANILLQNVFFW